MGCADENSTLIGNNGKTYATQVIKNEPHLKIITLIAVHSHKNIMPGFHEINPAPEENFCRSYPNTNCALFVSYFDPKSGKSDRLAGVLSNDVQCVSKGQSPNTKCVQVAQAPGACRNLSSGSGVYVQVNDFPYLVGILAVDHTCIHDGPAMIPFYDVCNDIENSKDE
uniref:Peptidase S1 domain-containing protein n=1 Tax=Romanomermis culicivorax TaxID=13658 RepID=A0A915JP18_ROMCU